MHYFNKIKKRKFFVCFKQICNKHFVLYIYNSTKLIQLKTDINKFVIKTCLMQKYNNKKYPIVYYSNKNVKNKIKL